MADFLYGINPVTEAVRAGRRPVLQLLLNKGSENNPRLKKLVQQAMRKDVKCTWVDKQVLFDRCQTREHQGVVAEVGAYPYVPFADLLNERRLILLDNIEDPHNTGAIMRTAEILGWKNVLLPRRGSPMVMPSVAKAAAGACEFLNVAVNCSSNQYVKIAQENGYAVVALDGAGKVTPEELVGKLPEKVLLVIGGENCGVSQFILNCAEHVAAIKQVGNINSLNASVAAALAMYVLA